jgi:hypothetical protein
VYLHIHKSWKWFAGIALVLIIVLGWAAAQRIADVAAVQDAVERDLEVGFGEPPATWDKPPVLPAWIDEPVTKWIERRYGQVYVNKGQDVPGHQSSWPLGPVYQERFRALFRGPIHNIHIAVPLRIRGDLGGALARFPMLRRVALTEFDVDASEADWKLLFTRFHALPRLEELNLEGYTITDQAIAPLAGHPHLRRITINDGKLTVNSAKIFATLPHLEFLHIEGQYDGNSLKLPFTEEQKQAFATQLPRVTIELPD